MLKWIATAVIAGALVTPTSVPAQSARSTLREACSPDYQRLCAGIAPGGGRIRKCMLDNSDKLSNRCKAALSGESRTN
jgi:hypothetical protein